MAKFEVRKYGVTYFPHCQQVNNSSEPVTPDSSTAAATSSSHQQLHGGGGYGNYTDIFAQADEALKLASQFQQHQQPSSSSSVSSPPTGGGLWNFNKLDDLEAAARMMMNSYYEQTAASGFYGAQTATDQAYRSAIKPCRLLINTQLKRTLSS
jgi:hypothetical protein